MNNAYLGANASAIALALASGVLYAQEPAYVTNVSFNHATSQVAVELSLNIPNDVIENNRVTLFLNGSFDVASVEGEINQRRDCRLVSESAGNRRAQ